MPKKKTSKTDYVLAHPKLSASEIVALAKTEGIKLSGQLVYVVRGRAKKRGNAPRRDRGRPKKSAPVVQLPKRRGRPPKAHPGHLSRFSALELQLAEVVVQLGLPRVDELLKQLRNALG